MCNIECSFFEVVLTWLSNQVPFTKSGCRWFSQRTASIMNATFAIDFVVPELSSLKQRIRTCSALSHACFGSAPGTVQTQIVNIIGVEDIWFYISQGGLGPCALRLFLCL